MQTLILASSSPYRREILDKLGLPFVCHSPNIDESAHNDETPSQLIKRLALEKAKIIADQHPNALVIGSDQVAVLDSKIITKPIDHQNAVQQLTSCSGREVVFLTSLCLFNSSTQRYQLTIEPFTVEFLPLSATQIEHYLNKEKPYNCAGSFKSEGLGITLFKRLQGNDPNSLVGLPLIELTKMLRQENIEPLA